MRRLFGCPDIVSLTEKFLMARNFFRIFTENNTVMGYSKTFCIPEAKGLIFSSILRQITKYQNADFLRKLRISNSWKHRVDVCKFTQCFKFLQLCGHLLFSGPHFVCYTKSQLYTYFLFLGYFLFLFSPFPMLFFKIIKFTLSFDKIFLLKKKTKNKLKPSSDSYHQYWLI